MKIRDVFSSNLRRHCAPRGTQTKLSAETGISTVQISRYLSGTIPGDKNLELIARFFGIEEHELFEKNHVAVRRRHFGSLSYIRKVPYSNNDVRAGFYFSLFPSPNTKELAIRSPTVLYEMGGMMRFRRYTGLCYLSRRTSRSSWNVHCGIVTSAMNTIYMSGYNRLTEKEPSLISLRRLPTEPFAMAGHALISVRGNPTSVPCIMIKENRDVTLRDHISCDNNVSLEFYEMGDLFRKLFDVPARIDSVFAI